MKLELPKQMNVGNSVYYAGIVHVEDEAVIKELKAEGATEVAEAPKVEPPVDEADQPRLGRPPKKQE